MGVEEAHVTRPSVPGVPGDKPNASAPPPPPWWRTWLVPLGVLATIVLLYTIPTSHTKPSTLSYTQFVTDVQAGQVKAVTITPDGTTNGTFTDGKTFTTTVPVQLAATQLLPELQAKKVEVTASTGATSLLGTIGGILISFLPFIVLIGFFVYLGRKAGGQFSGGALGVGRSKAKIFDAERPTTRFSDVAGYEGAKQEIAEIVDFLRAPDRYRKAGAIAPRGVLMAGAPGVGKTLLARAVAGEAQVPFISVTGSSFVEMFVGVGAARVRDLFAEARKRAPAIIFVDEIDAIGQRRSGTGAMVSNDEREQTLNQLLSEMDGFDPATGVVVLAATNRPEVLDPALLRPGRFDRQVMIPLPTQVERAAILAVHARGRTFEPDVDWMVVARGTPGFSGADLANLVNEAAIVAVRDSRNVVSAADLEAARDRIIMGRREGSNVLLPEEKRAVAVHESGHALVAAYCEHADPVHKVTILPSGQALGVTHQLPLAERHLYSESYLLDSLAVRLGGRAAELVVLGQGSTGASNDLASATDLATRMVREFGLSPELGPVGYPLGGAMYLTGGQEVSSRPFAEATQRIVDSEVSRLLREAEERAVNLLREHRDVLDELSATLLEHETVDGETVYRVAGRPYPGPGARPVPAGKVAAAPASGTDAPIG